MGKQAMYVADVGDKTCRLDLEEGDIVVKGMERSRCKKMLRSILDDSD